MRVSTIIMVTGLVVSGPAFAQTVNVGSSSSAVSATGVGAVSSASCMNGPCQSTGVAGVVGGGVGAGGAQSNASDPGGNFSGNAGGFGVGHVSAGGGAKTNSSTGSASGVATGGTVNFGNGKSWRVF